MRASTRFASGALPPSSRRSASAARRDASEMPWGGRRRRDWTSARACWRARRSDRRVRREPASARGARLRVRGHVLATPRGPCPSPRSKQRRRRPGPSSFLDGPGTGPRRVDASRVVLAVYAAVRFPREPPQFQWCLCGLGLVGTRAVSVSDLSSTPGKTAAWSSASLFAARLDGVLLPLDYRLEPLHFAALRARAPSARAAFAVASTRSLPCCSSAASRRPTRNESVA